MTDDGWNVKERYTSNSDDDDDNDDDNDEKKIITQNGRKQI